MDIEALRGSPIGSLQPIRGTDGRRGEEYEHFAYVPRPLPSSVELTSAAWTRVVEASAALAHLDQAGQQMPDAGVLRRPTIRREAQSTSAIEGTFAAFTELLEADLGERPAPYSPAVIEVGNYVRAAEGAFEWIADRPITSGLVLQLQRTLVANTASELSDAGQLRDRQVFIGPRGSPITEARFVPQPPGDGLRTAFDDWIAWVNADSDLPAVVRAALGHYQFETLHPFSDGNGRIGRLVIVLQLMQYSTLRQPLLIVSPWIEARRSRYQDGLVALSRTGDWSTWVEFFAEGLREQAIETHRQAEALLQYRESVRARIRAGEFRGVAGRIAEDLIETPVVTPTWAKARYGVSYQAANTAISKLITEGLLVEVTGRTYGRIFAAPAVYSALGVLELGR
jgi:Fic family protein